MQLLAAKQEPVWSQIRQTAPSYPFVPCSSQYPPTWNSHSTFPIPLKIDQNCEQCHCPRTNCELFYSYAKLWLFQFSQQSLQTMEAMSGITATSPASRSVTGRTPTTTAPSQRSTTMGIMDMSHHGMGMNMGSCKVTMLWNWNTSDACFVSSSWRITSDGMFAGSCIAVICLVVCLEFLRRCGKEYDRHLIRQHMAAYKGFGVSVIADAAGELDAKNDSGSGVSVPAFRPNVAQQAVRALLHMVQFAVAYLVML